MMPRSDVLDEINRVKQLRDNAEKRGDPVQWSIFNNQYWALKDRGEKK